MSFRGGYATSFVPEGPGLVEVFGNSWTECIEDDPFSIGVTPMEDCTVESNTCLFDFDNIADIVELDDDQEWDWDAFTFVTSYCIAPEEP